LADLTASLACQKGFTFAKGETFNATLKDSKTAWFNVL